MRFEEGRAWLSVCPVLSCEKPVIEAHVYGLKLRLETKAVPLKDALVLGKYGEILVNIWKGPTQFWATAWFPDERAVDKGHIYIQHHHSRHR